MSTDRGIHAAIGVASAPNDGPWSVEVGFRQGGVIKQDMRDGVRARDEGEIMGEAFGCGHGLWCHKCDPVDVLRRGGDVNNKGIGQGSICFTGLGQLGQ